MKVSQPVCQSRSISNRGQVLIIFVFAIIGLIGITGLAIDGGNIYSDRRHAQNAADTASLAAALVKTTQQKGGAADCTDLATPSACGAQVLKAALDMAMENGYDNNITDNGVEVHIPPIDGPYADCSHPDVFHCEDYVQVIISTNVNTWFARVLGIPQLHNRVEAVALARYAPAWIPYSGMSLVELGRGKGSCPSDFNLGGSGVITLNGGGIYVNSSNPACAYKQTSCKVQLILNGGATVQVVGGVDMNGCASPTILKATDQMPWPPNPLIDGEPDQCKATGTFSSVGGNTTYQPGNYYAYGSFPVNNEPAILTPGVYCINRTLSSTKDITGDGVFIYIRPAKDTSVSISGGTVKLKAPSTGKYAGFLIYQDWVVSTSTTQSCGIQGNSSSQYTGLIFVPYCRMTIAGTSAPTGFSAQVIAYQLSLTGTNTLNFTYEADKLPKIPEEQRTGLYR